MIWNGKKIGLPINSTGKWKFWRRLGSTAAKKSAISCIENHAEDIRLFTLVHYAQALGKNSTLK